MKITTNSAETLFKGTKGEWRVMSANRMSVPYIVYSGNETIFQCYNTSGTEDAKANAQLISCAPEMLEMLQEIADKFDKDQHLLNVSPSKIKELITKATTI